MTNLALALKLVHVLGAAVLFGTGLGIAFFMWIANRSREPAFIAGTARAVVIADAAFTASAVVIQPLSGGALMAALGDPFAPWIVVSLVLYVLVGLCWLPVVWIQVRLRNLAAEAAARGEPLPETYHSLYRVWFWLGWPAFAGVLAIFALMIEKPALW